MIGNDSINFPMILVGRETKMELLPAEPRDVEFRLGFVPFFLYKGVKEVVELPEFVKVREAVEGLFNNLCKVKEHKKVTTGKSGAVLGKWSVADPQFVRPLTGAAGEVDRDQGKREGVVEAIFKFKKFRFNCRTSN